jgi:hypothetical protein
MEQVGRLELPQPEQVQVLPRSHAWSSGAIRRSPRNARSIRTSTCSPRAPPRGWAHTTSATASSPPPSSGPTRGSRSRSRRRCASSLPTRCVAPPARCCTRSAGARRSSWPRWATPILGWPSRSMLRPCVATSPSKPSSARSWRALIGRIWANETQTPRLTERLQHRKVPICRHKRP